MLAIAVLMMVATFAPVYAQDDGKPDVYPRVLVVFGRDYGE